MGVTAKDFWQARQVLSQDPSAVARAEAYETVIRCAMGDTTEAVRRRAVRELAERGITVTENTSLAYVDRQKPAGA